jgi:hypothetical protein
MILEEIPVANLAKKFTISRRDLYIYIYVFEEWEILPWMRTNYNCMRELTIVYAI